MTKNIVAIFIGSGLGGIIRYILSIWAFKLEKIFNFPFQTVLVNIIACFLFGFFATYISAQLKTEKSLIQSFLIIGFCGGFSTFSAFSNDLLQLMKTQSMFQWSIYLILSVVACLVSTQLGYYISKSMISDPI